ncbi:hypothetical protein L1887_54647 [Cichorium endivia]|nr:hypothetical protein L1887_54647 [Cichorium endivia]
MPCSLHWAATDDSQQRPIATQRAHAPSPDEIPAPMLPWPTLTLVLDIAPRLDPCKRCPRISLLARQRACVCARGARLQKRRRSSAAQGQSARRLRAVWTGKLRSEAAPGCASKADGCRPGSVIKIAAIARHGIHGEIRSQELISKIAHKKEKGQAKNVPRGSSPFVMRSLCMNLLQDLAPHLAPLSWLDACTETTSRQHAGLRTGSLVCPLDSRMFARSAPQIFAHPTQDPRRQDWAEAAQRKLEAWWMPLPANVLRLACAAAFEPDNRTLDPQPAAV